MKKITFLDVVGENGHNSINIKVSTLKSLAFDREQNLVKIKLKRDTRLQNKIEQKFPPFFNVSA